MSALVTGPVDIARTFYTWTDPQPVTSGATISDEGLGLVATLENGVETVGPSAGAGGEVVVGFAVFRQKTFGTAAAVDSGTIPTAGPFTVSLAHNNVISATAQIRVVYAATGAAFSIVPGAPAGAGDVQVDYVNGVLTFHSADAGVAVTVTYRYSLTVAQAQLAFQDSTPNHPDPNFFGKIVVGKGKGRLFTLNYDASVDWSSATGVKLLNGGALTDQTGAGPVVPGGRVVSVPSSSDPYLGIEFIL